MKQADPIIQALMSKGAPFEVIENDGMRVFKNAAANLADVLNRSRYFGAAEFIVMGQQRLTYDEFFLAADSLASHLVHDQNVDSGQSVAICMKNSPEWMIGFVAIIFAGGVAVLINSRGSGETMRGAIEDADCELVLADARRRDKLIEAGLELPVLSADDFPKNGQDFTSPKRLSTDLSSMFFTSGTTGRAKAAALSHRALVTGMMNTQMAMAAVFQKMATGYGIDVETLRKQMPQGCSLLVFPLFHTSGCTAVFLTTMSTGGKLVLMDRWDSNKALELIEKEQITTFGGVPTMHWDLLHASDFETRDLSSLMSISCGGQALPLNLLAEIRETFPRAFIGAGYGMTETSGAISQANGEAFLANPEASGQVLPMMDVQITGDDGKPVASGDVGEIWTKGATLMDGYYGRPDETAKSFSGPWFKTGDIGRIDENGYIYIVDRKTDMVISGGENIYCAEVEQSLGKHPSVLEVTTFGVPDDRLGERLVAALVLKDGTTTAADLTAFAKANMGGYKVPTEFIISDHPFALNAMGKIEKHKVRSAYLEGQDT